MEYGTEITTFTTAGQEFAARRFALEELDHEYTDWSNSLYVDPTALDMDAEAKMLAWGVSA